MAESYSGFYTMHSLLYTLVSIGGITSVLALEARVDGAISTFGSVGELPLPGQGNLTEFEASLANSTNATGTYAIAGPNISDTFSPTSTLDGWSWSITLAELPVPARSSSTPNDTYFTAGQINLNVPSSLVDSNGNVIVDDSWRMCLFGWDLSNNPYPKKLRSDDGTCSSILSDECVADIKKSVDDSINSADEQCACPKISEIPSCSKIEDAASVFNNSCYAKTFDAKRIREFNNSKTAWEAFGSLEGYQKGNETIYNDLGSVAWPVIASFGRSNEVSGEVPEKGLTTLSCVRAVDAAPGSKIPAGDEISSGMRLSGNWLIATLTMIDETRLTFPRGGYRNSGGAVCVGGPAFVMWVQPTDEELFKKYNPDLQKKSLERRYEKQKDFDDFVVRLKEYSKSDKPIWTVQEEAARKLREESLRQDFQNAEEAKEREKAMRREAGLLEGAGGLEGTGKSKLTNNPVL
ncbi:CBP4-domain-containing protein [Xylaria bambusicola]|uniref:CBP4-domain-containing protein n=1 Tax=Xylaria bambusicola TaxID=326684 RepID=UPI0020088DC8|nr:CBP4-domain-containing protein [Xylaria bambusicola]KAI0509217.1 CBP4-domain-containing protein [Xylaria bambusicola]